MEKCKCAWRFQEGEKFRPYKLSTNFADLRCMQVMKHFERYNILTNHQHGFRSKRSTELQLILTIHDMANAIQQNNSGHAAVLDFTKAFDKVPHLRL